MLMFLLHHLSDAFFQEALLHPSSLHVARSALRLGGVPWQRVRQQALKAERAELAAEASWTPDDLGVPWRHFFQFPTP